MMKVFGGTIIIYYLLVLHMKNAVQLVVKCITGVIFTKYLTAKRGGKIWRKNWNSNQSLQPHA